MRVSRCLAVVLGMLLCLGAAAGAELSLEIIALRYRSVEQVLPIIQPLVPKPGTVSGAQNNLIVRTTPANLAQVRQVLDAIDRMPRRLLITVRQDADTSHARGSAAISGTIGSGPGGAAPQARVYGTRSLDNERSTQQVQVLEGSEAHIHVGQSIPVPNRSIVRRTLNGRVVEQSLDSIEYRDVLAGFMVRPRLAGDIVTLDISPQRDTPGSEGRGSINVQRVSTTLSGRLGDWIEVGGVISGRSLEQSASTFRSSTATGADRRVLLKVEEIR